MAQFNDQFTATEMFKVATESNCQLNRIFKEIKEAAKENRMYLVWVINSTKMGVESIVNDLQTRGFFVVKEERPVYKEVYIDNFIYNNYQTTLFISWDPYAKDKWAEFSNNE